MLRNLLYNCCPQECNEEWRLNVEKLNQYADIFNGQRLIIVREGEAIVPLHKVKDVFSFDAEFILLPNDPVLHEVPGFIDILGKLKSTNPQEATFYAHTKGTRNRMYNVHAPLESIRRWRDMMYEQNLSNPSIDELLQTYACVGCFRSKKPFPKVLISGADSSWHYDGNFWWVNHARLFSKPNWSIIPQTRFGVEAYLGMLFGVDEGYCLYEDNLSRSLYFSWDK
jgi:hypothetical protein